jgi:hypothetical protein
LQLNYSVIVTDKLNIDQLKDRFKDIDNFETKDIIEFYKMFEPQINSSTVIWRIYTLGQKGILTRTGRGKFIIREGKTFIPEVTPKIKSLHKKLKKEFLYLKPCIWSTSSFNAFMIHQPGRFYILVEVEKDATQSVFFYLKEQKHSVFVEPTKYLIENYLPDEKETIIVKPLITEAPVQYLEEICTATLEKMMVDIFCDDLIFSAQQGSEMRTIFLEAMNKYAVNENRMLRYADRRSKKESFNTYLNSISNLRQ